MSLKIQSQIEESGFNLGDENSDFKNKNLFFSNNKNAFVNCIIVKILLLFFLFIIIFNKFEKSKISYIINYKNNRKKKISKIMEEEPNEKLDNILLNYEKVMPHLKEINKKRTFVNRLPLPKQITCIPHFFSTEELIAFLSFLTENTTFFETGSGCSSMMAKYFVKKSYAIEGCKNYYENHIKYGLKDILIFKDLKPDNPIWSYPGNKSNIEDWKNYFQSYKKEYNADVIFIDGRFKIATAMDMFNKIRDDTIILIHEYKSRPSYFILEEYYNYIYHWNTLYAFTKNKNKKEIPLEIQKKYWNQFL